MPADPDPAGSPAREQRDAKRRRRDRAHLPRPDARIVVDAAPGACLLVSSGGAVLHANAAARLLMGGSATGPLEITDLLPDWAPRPPADAPEAPVDMLLAGGQQGQRSARVFRKPAPGGGELVSLTETSDLTRSAGDPGQATPLATGQRERLRSILAAMSDRVVIADMQGNLVDVNSPNLGLDQNIARPGSNIRDLQDQIEVRDTDGRLIPFDRWPLNRLLRGEAVRDQQVHIRRLDTGHESWSRVNGHLVHDQQSGKDLAVVTVRDETALENTAAALRTSEERYRLLFENTLIGLSVADATTGRFIAVNDRFSQMMEYPREELLGMTFVDVTHPDVREEDRARFFSAVEQGRRHISFEKRYQTKSGKEVWAWLEISIEAPIAGRPQRAFAIVVDITGRKQVEHRLRESEARFRRLADSIPHLVWVYEPDGTIRYRNRRSEELFPPDNLDPSMPKQIHPQDVARRNRAWSRSISTGQPYECEMRVAQPNSGGYRWMLSRAVPVRDANGEIEGWYGSAVDIHDLKLAEQALQHERDRYLLTAKASPGVLNSICLDANGGVRMSYASPAIEDLTGFTPAQLHDDARVLQRLIHPDDLHPLREAVTLAARRRTGWSHQFRLLHPGRGEIWVEGRYAHGDLEDRVVTQHGVLSDVTESRRIAENLRETQKMEAIGRLAGGIAHDFNNLLTVILGEAELQLEESEPGSHVHETLSIITDTAGKASAIVRQLLTFSRRHAQRPCRFDLNERVAAVERLLQRLAGDLATCQIELNAHPLLILADPIQIEQALFNLVVNARDAVDGAGQIQIRTRRVVESPPGAGGEPTAWAELSVSDTGPGIPPNIAERLFEPFFTTKETGKGTGLGLAVVHGVAEHCGGSVMAENTPAGGARFRMLLPLSEKSGEEPDR